MRYGETVYGVIGRGKAGWHATGKYWQGNRWSHCSVSGMVGPDDHAGEAEGALVYDADAAPYDAFAHVVFSGPMADNTIPAGMVERAFGTWPRTFETYDPASPPRGLDSVAVDVYERILREVPGVRFGRVVSGKVVWE